MQILASAPRQDGRFGSKADICAATSHVRFTPNSDRESEIPQNVMSALPSKADMCGLRAKSGQTRLDDMRWFIDPNRRFGINLVWLNFLNLFAYPV
jgi:hypothetical protein